MQLQIRRELSTQIGKEDFELGYAHNQMGCSWMMAKDFKKGAQLFREALNIWHRIPGYTKGLALMEYANLGMSLWLQGKIDEAAEVLEEGQRESEDGLGKMSTSSFRLVNILSEHECPVPLRLTTFHRPGRVLHALGNVRYSQGRLEESEQFHRDALKTFQAAVGNKYHRTADMCHKLAQHSMRRADKTALKSAMQVSLFPLPC